MAESNALRVTEEMQTEMSYLGYERVIKKSLGFNFASIYKEHCDIDNLNHDQLRRHMIKLNNDMFRFDNQMCNKVNEELYHFNNCHNMQKYVNELKKHKETCDVKFLRKYFISHYKDVLDYCTLRYEGLKNESLLKQKKHIKEHASEKIICECGASVSRAIISRHKLTKKHLDNMPPLEE